MNNPPPLKITRVTSHSNTRDVYWTSMVCQSRAPPDWIQRAFSLKFSFVNFRDSELRDGFRLIVVDKTEHSGALLVDEWRNSLWVGQKTKGRPCEAPYTLQESLKVSQTRTIRQAGAASVRPFTVALECIHQAGAIRDHPELVLRPFQPPSPGKKQHKIKLVFDRIYSLAAGNHGLITILDVQTSFSDGVKLKEDHLGPNDHLYISVIRNQDSRLPAPSLPIHLITSIAEHILGDFEPLCPAWCKAIFPLGMVNRSWAHIFDLRWKLLGSGLDNLKSLKHFRSATLAIERGLSARASSYMKGFDMSMFHCGDKWEYAHFVEFATKLIRNSKYLLHMNINVDIFYKVDEFLPAQNCVERFSINCVGRAFDFSLGKVRSFIQSWTKLRTLRLVLGGKRRNDWGRDTKAPKRGTTSFLDLEELTFCEGSLPGSEFIRMLPTSCNRLHTLLLHKVLGLSTCDISIFFSLTHTTLVELRILGSPIRESLPQDTKSSFDYPLDTWIKEMKHLRLALVPGTVASMYSISRKIRIQPQDISSEPTTTDPFPLSKIEIRFEYPTDIIPSATPAKSRAALGNSKRLVSMINRSGWDEVYLSIPMGCLPNDAMKLAIAAAEKKGMVFKLHSAFIV